MPRENDKTPAATRLDSWKEIAVYLKRSVRTVQRWEKVEELPVHRHFHNTLESVYAYGQEVDAWWRGRVQPARAYRGGERTPETSLRIAILPFEPLGADPEEGRFSEGLTEDLVAAFVRLEPERIEVIAVSPVLLSKGVRSEPRAIAQRFGAHLVVKGCVRRIGKKLRINAHLIRAREQTHLWAGTYDRVAADSLRTQTEIAEEISSAVPLYAGGGRNRTHHAVAGKTPYPRR
ncbi:MAG TPA: hypothetical protein VF860_08750 [Candidatus Acidoferrales bacterium]